MALKRHQRIHGQLFAGWAVANLLIGGVAMFFTEGQWHQFHHMNAAWGSINALIAWAFWRQTRKLPATMTPGLAARKTRKFQRFLHINLGLDLLYTGGGVWLLSLRIPEYAPMLQGFGKSILLQGLVLLALDATSLIVLRHNRAANSPMSLKSLRTANPNQLLP